MNHAHLCGTQAPLALVVVQRRIDGSLEPAPGGVLRFPLLYRRVLGARRSAAAGRRRDLPLATRSDGGSIRGGLGKLRFKPCQPRLQLLREYVRVDSVDVVPAWAAIPARAGPFTPWRTVTAASW